MFPPKFKEIRHWLTFKEEFQAYLRMKRGVNKTPLMHVLRCKKRTGFLILRGMARLDQKLEIPT